MTLLEKIQKKTTELEQEMIDLDAKQRNTYLSFKDRKDDYENSMKLLEIHFKKMGLVQAQLELCYSLIKGELV